MKILSFSILLIIITVLTSCEKISDAVLPAANEDLIVVEGWLNADKDFKGLRITHPVSLNQNYNATSATVTDIDAYIRVNGIHIYPLHLFPDGYYRPLYGLIVRTDSLYELLGNWNGSQFYARTIIPKKPQISGVTYIQDNSNNTSHIEVKISADTNKVYGAKWVILYTDTSSQFNNIVEYQTGVTDNTVIAKTTDLPAKYLSTNYNLSTYVIVSEFDPQYIDYFNTKQNNQISGNPFTQANGSVNWNVKGEKAIGLFIGVNTSPPFNVSRQ
jgi:hypothetical protein